MERDAVQEAVTLLLARRSEAAETVDRYTAEVAALETEISRIDSAIAALQLPTGTPERDRLFTLGHTVKDDTVPVKGSTGRGPSVKTLVRDLLESEAKEWSASEILTELEVRGAALKAADPASAIRTALWNLRNDGIVVQIGEGRDSRNIAALWTSKNAEGSDFSEPSVSNHTSAAATADPS